ncbi:transcriptional regulator [Williamsia sp. CHRR-6]|uniref:transcriptional regulator n=1 Tax=Williamsia sp. CHRR-6 TaxID=2835871 RepID=UPI001BDB69C8|nr:transcriptional regulator [Williamsia sp. CHRR-6]MBT0565889.1 transcriptional regulator [Williamsia sp. CHRR-6]
MDDLDAALHSPPRLKIMSYLFAVAQSDFAVVAQTVGLSAPELSKHLKVLRERGLVRSSVRSGRGAPVTVFLTKQGEREFRAYRKALSQIVFQHDTGDAGAGGPATDGGAG